MQVIKNNFFIFFVVMILFVFFVSSETIAAPISLSTGQIIDLNLEQIESLKKEPGISFFPYRPERIIKSQIQNMVIIELPDKFGGGFLIGTRKNIHGGLNSIGAVSKSNDKTISSGTTVERKIKTKVETEFILNAGYRVDDLDWNIAGDINGNNPNVLSELTWDDIETYQIKLRNKTIINQVYYFRGEVNYGWIFAGDNQDSDYANDNRTGERSRSNNKTKDNNLLDASLGVGYQFTFKSGKFGITPLIGYSYHEQNLQITQGYQTIGTIGPIKGLDSSYDTQWKGPWVGLDFMAKINKKNTIFAELEYHWADYYAKADWNVRSDLSHPTSFEHDADGNGIIISIGWNYFFKPHWGINLNIDYQNWSTDNGTDRVFLANGTIATTRLNEVNWESHAVMIGIVYKY